MLEISWQGAQSSFCRTNRLPRRLLGLNQSAGALELSVSVGSWLLDTEVGNIIASSSDSPILHKLFITQKKLRHKMVSLDLYTQNIPLTQVLDVS